MTFLDRLVALIPFRQPRNLHDPRPAPFDPPADLKLGRLDLADGLPRPARPETDADDLAAAIREYRQAAADLAAVTALADLDPGPCMQRDPGPPFEPCPNPAHPESHERLCTDHANRRRT